MPSFDFPAAWSWLEAQYDPAIGLVRASPNAEPSTFYIFNDNYLAGNLLWNQKILTQVHRQAADPRIVEVFGVTTPWLLQPNNTVTVQTIGSKLIKSEFPNGNAAPLSVRDYADIAFYQVLDFINRGNRTAAVAAFQTAEQRFWDGKGFKDKTFTGLYQLYKNALYALCAARLNYPIATVNPQRATECRARIAFAQRLLNGLPNQHGGVLTEYDGNLLPTGDANVETLVICFLEERYSLLV